MEILLHDVHQPIGFLLPINATEAVIYRNLKTKINTFLVTLQHPSRWHKMLKTGSRE